MATFAQTKMTGAYAWKLATELGYDSVDAFIHAADTTPMPVPAESLPQPPRPPSRSARMYPIAGPRMNDATPEEIEAARDKLMADYAAALDAYRREYPEAAAILAPAHTSRIAPTLEDVLALATQLSDQDRRELVKRLQSTSPAKGTSSGGKSFVLEDDGVLRATEPARDPTLTPAAKPKRKTR